MNLKSKLSSALSKKAKNPNSEKSSDLVISENASSKAQKPAENKKTSNLSSMLKTKLTGKAKPIQHAVNAESKSEIAAKQLKTVGDQPKNAEIDFSEIQKLANLHNMPEEFIQRGFECSKRMGIGIEYFVNRYIKHDDTPFNKEFEAVYKDILSENRAHLWTVK